MGAKQNTANDWDEFEWEDSEKSHTLGDILYLVKKLFPWIVICGILGMAVAWVYYKRQEPQYLVKAKILIKDDNGGGAMKNADVFQSLGMFSGASSVDNELEIITTNTIMEKVVNKLKLNVVAKKDQFFNSRANKTYDVPWEAEVVSYLPHAFDTADGQGFKISKDDEGYWIDGPLGKRKFVLGQPFPVSIGKLVIKLKPGRKSENGKWLLNISNGSQTVQYYIQNIQPSTPNKNTSIITLEMKSPNPKRDQKVMNTLIDTYVQEGVKDNNSINDSTLLFINERLGEVTGELRDVEGAIQNFKQRNQLTDIAEQTKVLLDATSQNSQKLIDAEIQLNVVSSLENHVRNSSGSSMVPTSLVSQDPALSALINQYNDLVVQKDRLGRTATPENPLMRSLNTQLGTVRTELLSGISSSRRANQAVVSQLRSETGKNMGMIRKIPQQEREFLDISRQQAIKQELYLFLLKKREETAIGKSSTLSNTRVIDYARVVDTPVSPKRNMILLAGLLAGALIPFIVSFLRRKTNTTLQTKNDIKSRTNMPIMGEIGHHENPGVFEVKTNPRSALAEQFRILRTNLHFYKKEIGATTVMLTSSVPGEGKTFTSLNLAATLAANTEVKVLVIGMDLRKPRLTKELNLKNNDGFSDYIVKKSTLDEIILPVDGFTNLFVMPSGTVPPNPSELLMSKAASQMFDEIKTMYDFIVIDCPPAVVTDYQIISNYVDVVLYVTRAGYTEKRQLEIADELYRSGKMPKMSLIVNDFDPEKYDGYNSNYYSQYGYYDSEPVTKSFFAKLLGK